MSFFSMLRFRLVPLGVLRGIPMRTDKIRRLTGGRRIGRNVGLRSIQPSQRWFQSGRPTLKV
eukprot:179748-Amorphochlora_amoeboformis.AAC.1